MPYAFCSYMGSDLINDVQMSEGNEAASKLKEESIAACFAIHESASRGSRETVIANLAKLCESSKSLSETDPRRILCTTYSSMNADLLTTDELASKILLGSGMEDPPQPPAGAAYTASTAGAAPSSCGCGRG